LSSDALKPTNAFVIWFRSSWGSLPIALKGKVQKQHFPILPFRSNEQKFPSST